SFVSSRKRQSSSAPSGARSSLSRLARYAANPLSSGAASSAHLPGSWPAGLPQALHRLSRLPCPPPRNSTCCRKARLARLAIFVLTLPPRVSSHPWQTARQVDTTPSIPCPAARGAADPPEADGSGRLRLFVEDLELPRREIQRLADPRIELRIAFAAELDAHVGPVGRRHVESDQAPERNEPDQSERPGGGAVTRPG